MRALIFAAALIGFAGCGSSAPHEYPPEAQVAFHQECPADNPVCVCTWDRIIRALPHEEYEAALERFRAEGVMDPRVTRASTKCREQHAG